jgi:hypothetical protein
MPIERPRQQGPYLLRVVMSHPTPDISPATTDADEREHGRHDECQPTPDLVNEKVCGPEHFHVDTGDLPPGHGVCALRSGRNAVTLGPW